MKIFALIMAVLVLALSIMPCAGRRNGMHSGKAKTALTKSSHENGDEQEEDCSPFCQCSCCTGLSINYFISSSDFPSYSNIAHTASLSSDAIEVALPV